MNNLDEIPSSGLIMIGLASVGAMITVFTKPKKEKSDFVFLELLKVSCLVYAVIAIYGISAVGIEGPFKRFQYFLLPIILVAVVIGYSYSLCVTLISDCKEKNYGMCFVEAIKPALSVLIVYYISMNMSFLRMPFHQIMESTSPYVSFVATGFWCACATWPAVIWLYFSARAAACTKSNFDDIESKTLDDLINKK